MFAAKAKPVKMLMRKGWSIEIQIPHPRREIESDPWETRP